MSDGRAQGLSSAGFSVGCATPGDLGQVIPFPAPATSNRACGSPAPGSPTPFTGGVRFLPPGLVRPGRDDYSRHADQATSVGREVGDHVQAKAPSAFVPLPDEDRQPECCIIPDLGETGGGVAIPDVAHPAAQEHVHVLHHHLGRQQQPGPDREFAAPSRSSPPPWPSPFSSGPGIPSSPPSGEVA
jgi:hypothetical protein